MHACVRMPSRKVATSSEGFVAGGLTPPACVRLLTAHDRGSRARTTLQKGTCAVYYI